MLTSNAKPTGFRWAVFGLACGTSWLLYLHRYAFALLSRNLSGSGNSTKSNWDCSTALFRLARPYFSFRWELQLISWGCESSSRG